ncbi:MAG: transporter substrate-binding domain-containing protein [Candidatus Promineifilaceae bacterium]
MRRPQPLDENSSRESQGFARTFQQRPPRLRGHLAWLLICCLLSLAACQSQSDAWTRIQRSGVLRVGIDPTYPPFAVATDNDLWGFDVDLMRAIAAAYDLEAQFIYFGYDGLYDALSTEQVDVLASALVVQPERTRDFAYSQPYFDAGQVLIVPAASPIAAPDDLAEHVLAVELGAQGHVLATTWQRRLPNLTIVPYRNVGEALDAAANGNADAALVDNISGRLYLQQTPHLVRLSPPVESEPYALVVRADDALLLTRLNAALQDLQRSGALDEIIRRWLDSPAN